MFCIHYHNNKVYNILIISYNYTYILLHNYNFFILSSVPHMPTHIIIHDTGPILIPNEWVINLKLRQVQWLVYGYWVEVPGQAIEPGHFPTNWGKGLYSWGSVLNKTDLTNPKTAFRILYLILTKRPRNDAFRTVHSVVFGHWLWWSTRDVEGSRQTETASLREQAMVGRQNMDQE